ncbi:MAG: DUF2158 domain-containing protein [Chitinophagaceae bacterium]
MERTFKTGDLVRLKSGGPVMTVLEYDMWQDVIGSLIGAANPTQDAGMITCHWFKDDEVKKAKFHQDMLEIVTN